MGELILPRGVDFFSRQLTSQWLDLSVTSA